MSHRELNEKAVRAWVRAEVANLRAGPEASAPDRAARIIGRLQTESLCMTPAEATKFDAIVADEVRQQRAIVAQKRQAGPVVVPWPLVIIIAAGFFLLLVALH